MDHPDSALYPRNEDFASYSFTTGERRPPSAVAQQYTTRPSLRTRHKRSNALRGGGARIRPRANTPPRSDVGPSTQRMYYFIHVVLVLWRARSEGIPPAPVASGPTDEPAPSPSCQNLQKGVIPNSSPLTPALQEALDASIISGRFADTKIYLFSHRNAAGDICGPKAVYASSMVLRSVPYFNDRTPFPDCCQITGANFRYPQFSPGVTLRLP